MITGNDTSSNSNHAHSDIKPTHDTKSVTEGRDFKLFVDHGSEITYCDVKPPFTEQHLTHSKIQGMSTKSVFEIDNARARLVMRENHCEVTISNARKKDTGKWDFQVSSAKDIRQFSQPRHLLHTVHYIFSVYVDNIHKPAQNNPNDTNISTTSEFDYASENGKCWDSRLSILTSRSDMEQNGWAFANVGRSVVPRSGRHDDKCGKDSWYGWKTPDAKVPASVSAFFLGSGSAVLDFGNCHVAGSIDVFLEHAENDVATKIDTAMAMRTSRKVSFEFREGTILNITTKGGIIKLNRLSISCNGQCCSKIRIGSKVLAETKLPRLMGYYQHHKNDSNGKPVWMNGDNNFLFLDSNGFWSIGDDYNTTSGAIHHYSCKAGCPELCSDEWSYTNPGWSTNKTVDVSCAFSPEIKGITNSLEMASIGPTDSGGVHIWNGNSYYFNTLPTYLDHASFFRIPHPISRRQNFEIKIYRPSTIFMAWYSSHAPNYNGGLEKDGWKRFSDSISTTWATLSYVYMKTFKSNGRTRIPFNSLSNSYFYGTIFIRDGTHANYGGHKLCNVNCSPCTTSSCYCSVSQLTNQCGGQCGCGNYQCEKCNCTAAPVCQIF